MKNTKNKVCVMSVLFTFLLSSSLSNAHHSFAMYDTSESIQFTGKVFRFIPGANHAQMLFEIIDDNGQVIKSENGEEVIWGLETGSSAGIARQGVTVDAFPIGSVVTFAVNPLRNGKTFGLQYGYLIHCGNELPEAGCTEETGKIFMRDRRR